MLKVDTLRKQERALIAIAQDADVPRVIQDKAYHMASALHWARGGCTWTPLTLINDEVHREIRRMKEKPDADQG